MHNRIVSPIFCSVRVVMATARPTIKELSSELSDVVGKWRDLGIELEIPSGKLDAIKDDHGSSKQRLTAMLEWWLSKYPKKGWKDIVDALRAIDKEDVADIVQQKYCGTSAGAVPLSTPSGTLYVVCTYYTLQL